MEDVLAHAASDVGTIRAHFVIWQIELGLAARAFDFHGIKDLLAGSVHRHRGDNGSLLQSPGRIPLGNPLPV